MVPIQVSSLVAVHMFAVQFSPKKCVQVVVTSFSTHMGVHGGLWTVNSHVTGDETDRAGSRHCLRATASVRSSSPSALACLTSRTGRGRRSHNYPHEHFAFTFCCYKSVSKTPYSHTKYKFKDCAAKENNKCVRSNALPIAPLPSPTPPLKHNSHSRNSSVNPHHSTPHPHHHNHFFQPTL
jgi:hypothetical protein